MPRRTFSCIPLTVLIIFMHIATFGGELVADEKTLLLLHCNGSLQGAQGEIPDTCSGVTYREGVFSDGAYFARDNLVTFASPGNVNSSQGTIEAWIKPPWDEEDNLGHIIFQWSGAGGVYFAIEDGNFLRVLLNRFASQGKPEVGCGYSLNWRKETWHHVATSWDSKYVKLYCDGDLVCSSPITIELPAISDAIFHLGSEEGQHGMDALIDEMRISSCARSSQEIKESHYAGLTVYSIKVEPEQIDMMPTWREPITLKAETNLGSRTLPVLVSQWTSSAPSVAAISDEGLIVANSPGEATLTADVSGLVATVHVTVQGPVLQPVEEVVDPILSTPAPGAIWEIPVIVLRYLPTKDGVWVDDSATGWLRTLDAARAIIDRMAVQTKFVLEEGSRFRGYSHPEALPSLGYRIVRVITVYEEFPRGPFFAGYTGTGVPGYFPDYVGMFERFGLTEEIERLGVKEVWVWGYEVAAFPPRGIVVIQPESDMSSPTTGDISNSFRFNDDLPVCDHTYTLYGYNSGRSCNETVENHGHQLEAILSYACNLQDGNADLFWKKFVGQNEKGEPITGRCGWSHMPPNTTNHYDTCNMALVPSDIEDWRPDGNGEKKLVNADTWKNQPYAWPPVYDIETCPSQWFIYWMQSMPGHANVIPIGDQFMTNWWNFTGDWDGAIKSKMGLYGPGHCAIACAALAAPSSGQAPLDVSFLPNISVGHCSVQQSFEWDFGDGQRSSEHNPSHTFQTSGTFTWALTVTSDGEKCTATGQVEVLPSCSMDCAISAPGQIATGTSAVFSASVTSPCSGTSLYHWTFGDGGEAIGPEVRYVYGSPGTYEWRMTVTAGGTTCTKSGRIDVQNGTSCESRCTPDSGKAPLNVSFSGTATPQVIQCNYGGPYALDDRTVLLSHFDGNAMDSTGKEACAYYLTFADGRFGQGVQVNGTLSYATPASMDPARGAVEAWVNLSWDRSGAREFTLFEIGFDWYNRIRLMATTGSTILFALWDDSQEYGIQCDISGWQDGEWHHVAATWDDKIIELYTDGKLRNRNDEGGHPSHLASSFFVGSNADCSLQGEALLDEIRLSTVARVGNSDSCSSSTASSSSQFSYQWDFGDGSPISFEQNPSHTYKNPGTYIWSFTASQESAVCSQTGSVTVEEPPPLPGDCNVDSRVTIGEVQGAINMFLGTQAPGCGVDCDGDGRVAIGELQKVINAFLGLPAEC